MGRHKDTNWNIGDKNDIITTWTEAQTAILMDIRDELKELNRTFSCTNFREVPSILREIRDNQPKRRKLMEKAR